MAAILCGNLSVAHRPYGQLTDVLTTFFSPH